jgi:hypothetical protein
MIRFLIYGVKKHLVRKMTTKLKDLLNEISPLNTPPKYSNPEAKIHLDTDIKKMSKHLGKASQQCIKIMMDGVKGGRYDALDIQRGIEFGPWNRTHEGERPFMKMLWRKVRDGFRRYSKNKKLRR